MPLINSQKCHATRIRVHFHVTEFNDGGIESSLIQWLSILDRNIFQVSLSVTYPSFALESRFRALIPKDVPVKILAERSWLHFFQTRRQQKRLGKAGRIARDLHEALFVRPYTAKRIKNIAAHTDLIIDFDLSLRRLCGQFNVPWLGVNHFSLYARLKNRKRRIRRMAIQYSGYDCFAVLNEDSADEAAQMFGAKLKCIKLLPNPISIDWIKQRAEKNAVKPTPNGEPYIVSVARLDEIQKDHKTLLKAYAVIVRQQYIQEHLVIVGDGAFKEELKMLAHELSIADRVHFTGQLENPHPIMAHASLFVLSSKYEGLPMVLVEALALGKTIIATDCPTGPRTVLDHGKAGILIPVGDVSALAKAMTELLKNEKLRQILSFNASERAQFYDIAQSNQRFLECFDNIKKKGTD